MLTIVVCVRYCADVSQLRADAITGAPRLDEAPIRGSTLDEHAVETAVRLKEAHGGRITALSLVTTEPPRELVQKLLAMGADEARLMVHPSYGAADALGVAGVLAEVLRHLPYDLVLFGEGSIDHYQQQGGPRVAEALGVPSLTCVGRVAIAGRFVEADRLLEDRIDTVRCALPAVATVGLEAPAPRLPAVLQIFAAGRKPVVVTPGPPARSSSRILDLHAPPSARRGVRLEGEPAEVAERLARILPEEGVLP